MATSSSSGTPGDLILDSLEDLLEYDFKKCKSKLSDFSKGNKRPIPRGHLENANRINTKDLLVDKYGEVEALEVLIEVLKQIGLMRPASDLLERRGQAAHQRKTAHDDQFSELKRKHMELVKEKFQQVEEHNTRLGECVSLQAKYICLLIREGYPDRKDVEHEIERGRRSRPTKEKRSAEYNLTSLDALFDPNIDGIIPKVVVLHGPAGIGKTWTSRKIMLDWASGDLYQDKFDYLFYLSCRELNKITGRMSLVQLLSRTHNLTSDDLMTILKYSGNHQRLLFVIDGFDEFQWALEEVAEAGHDLSEETHKEALLQSLIRRPVLSQSSLLITTRSLAQKKLKPFIGMHSRYTELRGFSDEGRRKYVKNFFKNEADAEKALSVIEDNSILFIMCTVPILCWIVCTMLRKEMDNFLDFLQYKTTTSIYLQYLKGLMNYHGRNRPLSACLRKLCSLAKDGVLNQKILFKEMDLQNHGLSVSEVESVFLNENIFDDSFETETCYSFIHVSVQEFLAALYDVLDDGDEERASGLTGEASLPEICKGGSLPELCDEHPHLSSAVRFLLGLLFEKKLNEFSEKTGCKISLRVRSAVEEWLTGDTARSALKEWIAKGCSSKFIDGISCLYETQEKDLIKRALPRSSCITLDYIWWRVRKSKNEKKQLCYCQRLCEFSLKLSICGDELHCEEQETHELLHRCQQLCLTHCHFLQRGSRNGSNGPLTSGTELTSSDDHDDMEGRANKPANLSWLFKSESKIQELSVTHCHFLQRSSRNGSNGPLTSGTELTSSDDHDDMEGRAIEPANLSWLIKTESKIQELRLQMCGLSPLCCDVLRSALITNRSLTKLDLSRNNLEDSGVERLCEGLRNPRCRLQELRLQWCDLSSLCCDFFASALLTNRTLTKLDLSENNLQDSGVRNLCRGLGDPRCRLQELIFYHCGATVLCLEVLRSLITTHLTYLQTTLEKGEMSNAEVISQCEELQALGYTLYQSDWGPWINVTYNGR